MRQIQSTALTTRKSNSDTRVAIKTLFYSVTKDSKDIEECFEKARKDIVFDMVHNLSDENLMILLATATSKSDFAKPSESSSAGAIPFLCVIVMAAGCSSYAYGASQ
jgi:hypothetical protein